MLDRLGALEHEYAQLEVRMSDPALFADQARMVSESRRYKELGPIVAAIKRHRDLTGDLEVARELLTESSGAERESMREQVREYETALDAVSAELEVLMLPRDPHEGRAVIVEIRGAEGGEEANLFARDLFEMYRQYAARNGWRFDMMSADVSDLGGYNQVVVEVTGEDAWTKLKHEGGPHRVQRVPVTESQGRVHTSSATVLVLPEVDEVEVTVDPGDLHIDVYRSTGAGGQSVNTTDSAVRITHVPTGVVVTMQDERSQIQNRARAMTVLRARLAKLEADRVASELAVERKAQVGGGGRSEKIRTYNYKENRITDHRIGLTLYKLQAVMNGDLDEIVDPLVADERARLLAPGS
jgi:peptide chain release factor 1